MTAYVPGTQERDLSKFAISLQQLASGRSNAVGMVTLRANETTTTVNDINCAIGSAVLLTPATANAAAASGTWHIVSANKSFTITHANNSQTDRTFYYAIQG